MAAKIVFFTKLSVLKDDAGCWTQFAATCIPIREAPDQAIVQTDYLNDFLLCVHVNSCGEVMSERSVILTILFWGRLSLSG